MINTENIEETLVFLVANSKPGGRHMKRLLKLQCQVNRNVFLGPKARRFIHEMVEKLDNIECQGVTLDGGCRLIPDKRRCDHRSKFTVCDRYQPVSANIKGSPLQGLGGSNE